MTTLEPPSPTLNTILMVENTLKQANESVITIAELKRQLPRQVNHNTLMRILEYLEESKKIVVSLKGITWVQPSLELQNALRQGIRYED